MTDPLRLAGCAPTVGSVDFCTMKSKLPTARNVAAASTPASGNSATLSPMPNTGPAM